MEISINDIKGIRTVPWNMRKAHTDSLLHKF